MIDATAAWDFGYGHAVKGGSRGCANADWSSELKREWENGWETAVAENKWGTHPQYRSR